MKKIFTAIVLALITVVAFSQKNAVIMNGGYSWVNVDANEIKEDDPNIKGTGWRINGEYAWNPNDGNFAYGIALGYISVGATYDDGGGSIDYKFSTIPMYFAPRYMFGSEKLKGFIKAIIGFQLSTFERKVSGGTLTGDDNGFYGGGGAGILFHINDRIFLDAEYEIAYLTNDYYRNGLMQTVMGGIGVKF
jgi:hypothetical protein